MRYFELDEGNYAEQARKESEKQARQLKKVADARQKKATAARQYQDRMRAANDAEIAAISSSPSK